MNQDQLIVQCTRCGTKNRIPRSRTHDKAMCGKCRMPITAVRPFSSGAVNVTDASFAREVLEHSGPVLVDFWAPWCGPCRMVSPVLEQLADEYSGKVKVVKLNVDENPSTASRYSIRSIPSLLFFKGGNVVNTLMGARPKEELQRHIQSML
ncbi:MAG: thioredoxin TrxC [Deltaproteobacteria bacterium]|nr:thioredoxin TrxC [Deltaproteobacteria bacterium]